MTQFLIESMSFYIISNAISYSADYKQYPEHS